MKKIIISEGQENVLAKIQDFGEMSVKYPAFKEKCENIARLTNMSLSIHDGDACIDDEYTLAILGIDEGDGSKVYRPSVMIKSISFRFSTSDPAAYEAARRSFEKLMGIMERPDLLTL